MDKVKRKKKLMKLMRGSFPIAGLRGETQIELAALGPTGYSSSIGPKKTLGLQKKRPKNVLLQYL